MDASDLISIWVLAILIGALGLLVVRGVPIRKRGGWWK